MPAKTDAIVIGGGHNGLVAAGYLARAGMRVTVLEQRDIVGGLTTTEELWPGYFAEPASQIAHGIEPKVYRDMRLFDYNLEAVHPDPYLFMPFPDGRRFVAWRGKRKLQEEIRKFSEADAEAWFEYRDVVNELAEDLGVSPLEPPPTIQDLFQRVKGTRHEHVFYEVVFGSVKDFFDRRFESEEIKSALSMMATAFNMVGPYSASAYLVLHWALPVNSLAGLGSGEDLEFRGGTLRTKGGIGAITQAMAASVRADGAEIRTGARVDRVLVEDGSARGVVLESGESLRADVVLSNADARATLLGMVDPSQMDTGFLRDLRGLRRNGPGSKFIMAIDGEPQFAVSAGAEDNFRLLQSSFRFCPSMDYQERAYDDAKYGIPSQDPIVYAQCPTAIDPSLAPPGKHLLAFSVFHAPYRPYGRPWDEETRGAFAERILATTEQYLPRIREQVIDWKFFSPADLEARVGAPGGSMTHGEMLLPRLLGLYPQPHWADGSTPIQNLYICGASTWPGGGVTGAPGHNAAQRVLATLDSGV